MAKLLTIHSIAARWRYSNIPYDDWLQSPKSHSLNAQFGWRRDHFDRLLQIPPQNPKHSTTPSPPS